MRRYGAERAAAEAAAVETHGVAYHLVGRNSFPLVARMRQTGVGQVERGISLGSGHRRIHRVDLDSRTAVLLPDHRVGDQSVALLLYVFEIGGLQTLVAQTFLL